MKEHHAHSVLYAGTLVFLLFSAGCMGEALPLVDSWGAVQSGEAIVVGRIEISPPLDEVEQSMKTVKSVSGGCLINPSAEKYKNVVILLTDTKLRKLGQPEISDYANRIEAPLGRTFYVAARNSSPLYVIGSEILMDVHTSGVEKARLPSGYKIDIRRGDKAIYIGTLKYYRDEFFDVKRIELIDDFERESAAFRKKFGSKVQLRKALVKAEKTS